MKAIAIGYRTACFSMFPALASGADAADTAPSASQRGPRSIRQRKPSTRRKTSSATARWLLRTKPPRNARSPGKDEDYCMAELAKACKGIAYGKYCGMKHPD